MAAEKFTAEQVADALIETRGMKTLAAKRLGCSYNTVQRYIDKYATVKDALRQSHAGLGDQVELTLANMALGKTKRDGSYEREPNITALIFLAKTKFKERGYIERTENVNLNVDTALLKQTIDAITEAGLEPAQVFNDLIREAAELKQNAGAAGTDTGS